MQGVPGRTALVMGGAAPSGQPVTRVLRALRASGAVRAATAVSPHVAAPLPWPSPLPASAGPH